MRARLADVIEVLNDAYPPRLAQSWDSVGLVCGDPDDALDSVTVKIDNKEVKNYLYTAREADALLKGGVQRLYLGNLKVGPHELVAFFSGSGPNARAYKRGASLRFEKGVGAKYLELKINDRQRKLEPEFEIKDWE